MNFEQTNFPVPIPHLEVNITYVCNLKCECCNHLGRYMKGIVPVKKLLTWYETWNKKISPERLVLLGGEPLLHPDIELILKETRRCWKNQKLVLISNGILFPRMPDSFWKTVRELNFLIVISKHFDSPVYNSLFEGFIQIPQKWDLDWEVMKSDKLWGKSYRVASDGSACPYSSDPQKAWHNCLEKKSTTLLNNQLYKCPQLAYFSHACRECFISGAWKGILDYQPLKSQATSEEIEFFINDGYCDQCSICPETFEYATGYEKKSISFTEDIEQIH